MRIFDQIFFLSLLTSFLGASTLSQAGETKTPPNIVLIMADDLGWMDVNYFAQIATGVPAEKQFYETPHLNQMANEGIVSTRFYANPLCTPSRAALITGVNSARMGLVNAFSSKNAPTFLSKNITPKQGFLGLDCDLGSNPKYPLKTGNFYTVLPNDQPSENGLKSLALPKLLPHYRSAFLGKWHLGGHHISGHRPEDFGFEAIAYHDEGWSEYHKGRSFWHLPGPATKATYLTDALGEMSVNWITQHVSTNPQKPFLLYLAHFAVHGPIEAKTEDIDYFSQKKTLGWNQRTEQVKYTDTQTQTQADKGHHNPKYASMLRSMDHTIGSIRSTLKTLGIEDNTVILFLSDNGADTFKGDEQITSNFPLRGHKGHVWEGGIKVPFIAVWPKHWKESKIDQYPLSITQIAPTLIDIAAAPEAPKTNMDGPSFLPLIEGISEKYQPEPIFIHEPFYRPNSNETYSEGEQKGKPVTNSPSTVMIDEDYKLICYHDGEDRLYKIPQDIGERNNLASKEPERVARMKKQISAWRAKNVAPRYDTHLNPAYNSKAKNALPALKLKPFIHGSL